MPQTEVCLYSPKDRKFFMLKYTDPISGKVRKQSTKIPQNQRGGRREAEKLRAELEGHLNSGIRTGRRDLVWGEFKEAFFEAHQDQLRPSSVAGCNTAFRSVERLVGVNDSTPVVNIDEEVLGKYAAAIRREGLSSESLATYLRTLLGAFHWAVEEKLLPRAPRPPKHQKQGETKRSRTRAISGEEFDRILDVVPKVCGEDKAAEWVVFLQALRHSGLRISEALELYWDDAGKHQAILNDAKSVLVIQSTQKNKQYQVVPMTPDLVRLLSSIPPERRKGRILRPLDHRGNPASYEVAKKRLIKLGRAAGVVTDTHPETGKRKCASAHDLRGTFLTNLAGKLMPADLQTLGRHASIQTTMKHYVHQNAESVGSRLWAALGEKPSERLSDDPQTTSEATPGPIHSKSTNDAASTFRAKPR